jgi:RNA polymerase sigma factor (TIGR02999 family)
MAVSVSDGPPDTGSARGDALPNLDALFPELYAELRRIARAQRRRRGRGDTLRTTAVVHETYVRLKEAGRIAPRDRPHFLALAARAMRFVLIDYARRAQTEKRGGGAVLEGEDAAVSTAHAESTLVLHSALERLAAVNERMARVVECRFFGGMTEDEVAQALGVSERTVRGDWQRAKIWLARDLGAPIVQP